MPYRKIVFLLSVFFYCYSSSFLAAFSQELPCYFALQEEFAQPDLSGLKRLRFLTTVDFPPFNYLDKKRHLLGYNIDLARAICAQLHVEKVCEIEAVPWEKLATSLQGGQAEAIIAGLTPSAEGASSFLFTQGYFHFPARFIGLKTHRPWDGNFAKEIVGVVKNTVHERMVKAYFPEAILHRYPQQEALLQALKEKKITLAFGDGLQFAQFFNSLSIDHPYQFIGKPYFAPQILGEGMQIAVMKQNPVLLEAFHYALQRLERKGTLEELYLRYFPIDFFKSF